MSWKTEDSKENSCFFEIDIEMPRSYKVVFFNDNFTTKDFVVSVLINRFHKSSTEAFLIMETIHQMQSAVVGVYPYDIAATRISLTITDARAEGFPLRCEMEAV